MQGAEGTRSHGHQNTADIDLATLSLFCSRLTFTERKALITLARSQSIPERSHSPILFSKVRPILNKLSQFPPFHSLAEPLVPEAYIVLRLLRSPITTGILIVYALGVELSEEECKIGKQQSFDKELLATQTVRPPEVWNWNAILNPDYHRNEVIHPLFPALSPLQRSFAKELPRLRSSMYGRIIRPHYTSRGISSQTSALLLNRVSKGDRRVFGNPRTFHRRLDRKNVTSRDVVHHFVRSGEWPLGYTEMKQRWYPSQLLPRTYFSWSGTDIAIAGYLRNFFNDLGDCFAPTHRHKRVQPDWLHSESLAHMGFLFYDLTSFTSWFHEQESFLRAVADRFRNVTVYLVGEDLTLSQHDLGSLIDGYTDYTSSFSKFVVSGSLIGSEASDVEYQHQCAGFLGIPGNLVTCTIPHGLALASLFSDDRELQVPGDDVGASFKSQDNARDIMLCASTLGVLQFDKVYRQPELCVYLKRLVMDLGNRISLAPMLIYPLLPYLINPHTDDIRSNRFKLPNRNRIIPRAAAVLVSFHRDLWRLTRGDIDPDSANIVRLFIRRVHTMVGLPFGGIFQGREYGVDDPESTNLWPDITMKFPVYDDDFVYRNPDLDFANRYITRMTIRSVQEIELSGHFEELKEGQTVIVRNSKSWRFLEDMGYVRIIGIPGEKIELIGEAARDAFLFASEPPFREVEVLSDMRTDQLVSSGVIPPLDSPEFSSPRRVYGATGSDINLQSWRYRKYVDLDDPRTAGYYGKSKEWVNDGISSLRQSLSPEPADIELDY